MKRPVPAAAVLALALFVVGCGGGSSSSTAPSRSAPPSGPAGSRVVACKGGAATAEALRASALDCAAGRKVMSGWGHSHACSLGRNESRGACSVDGFRCQSVRTDRGVSVSCARPGEAVAFIPRPGG
jgi:hypothetical protein